MVDDQNVEKGVTAEPVYIIDDGEDDGDHNSDDSEDDEHADVRYNIQSPADTVIEPAESDSDYFEKPRPPVQYTSDSESDTHKVRFQQTASGRSTPDLSAIAYGGHHRKSVSFDLSGDERSKSDYERCRTPESYASRYYDSEQEYSTSRTHVPRKGILRSASPSSSNNSSLEKKRPEKLSTLVPTVTRIKEIDSPTVQYVTPKSSSPHLSESGSSRGYRSPPPPPIESVQVPTEIERDNPFRDAFLDKTRTDDEYTAIAKAISKSPRSSKNTNYFFGAKSGWKSNEDLLQSERIIGGSSPTTVKGQQSKSTENLAARLKKPPATLPKPNVKKADLVRNIALDSFQNADIGHIDFAVFEHDPKTNEIHQISSPSTPGLSTTPSPKLPVRVNMPKSPSRPKDSPPPPPINFATMPKLPPTLQPSLLSDTHEETQYIEVLPPLPIMPLLHAAPSLDELPPSQRRPSDFIHENSSDNILVSEQEHRNILLQENELRNQLRRTTSKTLMPALGVSLEEAPAIPGSQYNSSSSTSYKYLIPTAEATKNSSATTKVPKSVSDKKRFFESAMEDQHKPTQKSEKVFSFLSKDEVEKLKQEEERKIATLCRDKKKSRLFDDANCKIDNRDNDEDDDSRDDDDNKDENDYSEDDDDNEEDEATDDGNDDAVDMHRRQQIYARNVNDSIDVLRETLSDDDAEDIRSKNINQVKSLKPTKASTTTTTKKISKLKAPTQKLKETKVKDKSEENLMPESMPKENTKEVILKPAKAIATKAAAIKKDEIDSKKIVQNKTQLTQMPLETIATSNLALTQKPSLLPKPKVKVVIPPALLQKQHQTHQQQQARQQKQKYEDDKAATLNESEYKDNVGEEFESEFAFSSSSRIPVRTANAEKRALMAGITTQTSSSEETSPSSTSELQKSKALINAEKRASWRAARLHSLEKGAVEAQTVIQNMTKITDDLLIETHPSEKNK